MTLRSVSLALVLLAHAALAGAQMPDLRTMSGTPLPAGDLPTGTVSVRVVRGDISNNVAGQVVELHGAGETKSVTTDATGRAVFGALAPGTTVHAVTVLDGARLESQLFPVPAAGGIKVMLVGGLGEGAPAAGPPAAAAPMAGAAAAPSGPAVPGKVVLGGQSRFVIEVTDGGLDVYNLFDIANTSTSPVATEPLVFALPSGAQSLTVLEASSPQAKAEGGRFVVTGPFAPGITTVQMAYRLPFSSGSVSFEQALPADWSTTSVVVRKLGGMTFRSPQAGSSRDVMSEGNTYVMASGQTLRAGSPMQFEFDGLPYHSQVPRFIALGLAVFIVGVGVWLAVNGPDPRLLDARRALEQKRASLLDELVALERQAASGTPEASKLANRREVLVAQLERVYAQLDRDTTSIAPAGPEPGAAQRPAPARAHAAR